MCLRGLFRATASRMVVISGDDAAMRALRQNDASKRYAGGLPDFPGLCSRFRLSNLPDEARFAANRMVKSAGHFNDNKLGRKS
jgi:hypothetical protein